MQVVPEQLLFVFRLHGSLPGDFNLMVMFKYDVEYILSAHSFFWNICSHVTNIYCLLCWTLLVLLWFDNELPELVCEILLVVNQIVNGSADVLPQLI